MSCAAPNPFHWKDLRSRGRDEILARAGVMPGRDGRGYEVAFLNAAYLVDPAAEEIVELAPAPGRRLSKTFQILLLRYLVAPNGGPVVGEEVSEKQLPGGVTFFQGPHTLHVEPIVNRYGRDPAGFEKRGLEMGGVSVPHGDKGMRFLPFPRLPVSYVLWLEDGEFPASVTVLFDRSITRWFELDMVFTLVGVLTERIVEGP